LKKRDVGYKKAAFSLPPHDLLPRFAKLHEHQWHTNWKNVVFRQADGCAGARPSAAPASTGGPAASEASCKAEFNVHVPTKVYGEFLAATKESAKDTNVRDAAHPGDHVDQMPAVNSSGWYKAVEILEHAAVEDSESFNAVVDQPDEPVTIVLNEDQSTILTNATLENGDKRTASANRN
jgi:hypothetical protein